MLPQFGENWFDYPSFYSFIVKKFESGSHFVEIGSWKGKSSSYMAVEIANSGKNIKFDCVDTWLGSPEHIHDNYVKTNTLYELFLNNMKPVSNYFSAIRKSSEEASKLYDDKSLDFVFIDAEHSYESVTNDIKLWEPKIKTGGIIAGHDYSCSWPAVTKAVDDYYGSSVIPFGEETFVWYVQK
jgi:cephalosporin hydroxylase